MRILAYLDPGSGSIMLQAILGGAAGAAVVFRLLKSKLKTLVSGKQQEPVGQSEAGDENTG